MSFTILKKAWQTSKYFWYCTTTKLLINPFYENNNHSAKSTFLLCTKIHVDDNRKDQKPLFRLANNLLHKNKSKPLPTHCDPRALADEFEEYFVDKISKIHSSFPGVNNDPCVNEDVKVPSLDHLLPTTCETLKKIIMKSNSKSCWLDLIPTSLLKKCLDSLLPILVRIVNLSFISSTVLDALKWAIVILLLGKKCF